MNTRYKNNRMPAGLDCDVSVSSTNARFKSTVLRQLSGIDDRMAALVQLVKLWAGAHGMNDATAGTFNSFALTLMVSNVLPGILCRHVASQDFGLDGHVTAQLRLIDLEIAPFAFSTAH